MYTARHGEKKNETKRGMNANTTANKCGQLPVAGLMDVSAFRQTETWIIMCRIFIVYPISCYEILPFDTGYKLNVVLKYCKHNVVQKSTILQSSQQ
jgi:hypothetical protein